MCDLHGCMVVCHLGNWVTGSFVRPDSAMAAAAYRVRVTHHGARMSPCGGRRSTHGDADHDATWAAEIALTSSTVPPPSVKQELPGTKRGFVEHWHAGWQLLEPATAGAAEMIKLHSWYAPVHTTVKADAAKFADIAWRRCPVGDVTWRSFKFNSVCFRRPRQQPCRSVFKLFFPCYIRSKLISKSRQSSATNLAVRPAWTSQNLCSCRRFM